MSHDLPDTIGPYQVLEAMGQGGMAIVYRARHEQTGQLVALKTVQAPQQEWLQGLRHEIRALARLRHPGIVRILDEGLHEGLPWYAMELLEGTPLNQYWAWMTSESRVGKEPRNDPATRVVRSAADTMENPRPVLEGATAVAPTARKPARAGVLEAPTRLGRDQSPQQRGEAGLVPISTHFPRLPAAAGRLDQALRLIQQLCSTLAYLHGEGWVHRDLKPQNILIRPDGRPVLIDFGLLTLFPSQLSRDALELEALGAGTAAYMAPEQIRGEACDARTDLYALGCVLYELVAGRKVFSGQTDAEVLTAHLEQQPALLRQLVEGVPPDLEELLQRLLAKEPSLRLGHAADVSAALERLGASSAPVTGLRARPYLYRPSFAGRQTEMDWLRAGLRDLKRDKADPVHRVGVFFVGGASGIGKTRLALELAREASRQDIEVLMGDGSAPEQRGGAPPLEPLRRPLQRLVDRCLELGPQESQRIFGSWTALLAVYEPSLKALPGALESVPPDLPPDAARMRLYCALQQVFEAVADRLPLLLILDDLQWADSLTLGFLAHLLRASAASRDAKVSRWMVLGLYRTEEAGAELNALLQMGLARHLILGPLEEEAVGTMIAGMLALPQPPTRFSRFVGRQAEGNPFFVAEYLRAAVDEGAEGRRPLLWRDENGFWQVAEPGGGPAQDRHYEELGLPSSLRELVDRRLQELPAHARTVIDAAAVVGREVSIELLTQIAGIAESDLDAGLDELLRRQVLEFSSSNVLRFSHDKLLEGAYERIDGTRLEPLHRAAAQAIEALPQPQREQSQTELGRHHERGGDPVRARQLYLESARLALKRYANEEAEALYRACLRLQTTPTSEGLRVINEFAEQVLVLQGRNEEVLSLQQYVAEQARALGLRQVEGDALRGLGRVHWVGGRQEQALHHYEKALEVFRGIGARAEEGNMLSQLAGFYYNQGHLQTARGLVHQALEIAVEIGDTRLEARASSNLAILYLDEARLEEARPLLERALVLNRQLKELRAEGTVLGNLGVLSARSGHFEEALRIHQQELQIYRDVGDRRFEANVLSNLGENCARLGRLEEACAYHEQSLVLHQSVGNRRFEGLELGALGRLARQMGDPAAAGLLEQSRELLASVGDQGQLGWLFCELGYLELAGPQAPGRAAELLAKAEALARETDANPEGLLGAAITKLKGSLEAFQAGQHDRLVQGELTDGLPEARVRAMRAHSPNQASI